MEGKRRGEARRVKCRIHVRYTRRRDGLESDATSEGASNGRTRIEYKWNRYSSYIGAYASSTECTYRPRRGELATIRRISMYGLALLFPCKRGVHGSRNGVSTWGTYKRARRFFFDRVKERKYYTGHVAYSRPYVRTCSLYQLCGSNVHDSALYRAALWDWAAVAWHRCWGYTPVRYTFFALACLVSN